MGRADVRRAQQARSRRAKKQKKSGIRRFFTWKKLLIYFFSVCLLGILAFIGLYLYVPIPDKANADAIAQGNVYKYSDGTVMARTGKMNREWVDIKKVPEPVQHAFVAAENKSFYQDSGISLMGTARGILNTLLGKGKQGGSTITQQYVKNNYLTQEQTVSRKLQEIVISLKVDNKYDKDKILEGYINTSYYGRNAYGIQAAARAYYGVDVEKLNVSQGAYLASLLQAPSQYDWAQASPAGKKRVQERWAYTLNNMVEMKWLDPARRQAEKFQKPKAPKPLPGLKGQVGYFIKAANEELYKKGVDEKELAAGGWTITLGIDRHKQQELEKAVKNKLTDDLKPKSRPVDADAQLGAVSVDPKNGHVVAMYGGAGYTQHYVNNALRSDYQPASTFKPLIFAAALENQSKTQEGLPIRPHTIYDGRNRRPVVGGTIYFAPPNEDEHTYGRITVQQATNNSVNSVFAQMGADVGLDKVKKTAVDMGMDGSKMDVKPAMTLGTMGASPLQMAGVYATLDAHGKKVEPALVIKATKRDKDHELPDPVGDPVLSPKTADTLTSVLRGVVDDGTAKEAIGNTDYQAAGKTGTSDDNKSAWFVGYTPRLVTAVGMFGEAAKTEGKIKQGSQVTLKGTGGNGRVNGGSYPARVWAEYTGNALGKDTDAKFDLDTSLDPGVSAPPVAPPSHTATAPTTPPPSSTKPPTNTPSKPATTKPPTPPTHTSNKPTPTRTPPSSPPHTPPDGQTGDNGDGGTDGQIGGPGGPDQ
ncbi:transglycosylase domain-containing protein [Streptomyces sp. MST-110588]|uniref:transglycosylase domain-containing protein n=1 Tax=Streptomyces sp. MST-110588 TaxID=2833628 RepID=UPI001F5D641B|nr:transglycosylase domain-containing protein [Streptomyces sp. MST-110588]UNO40151.1 penicillin-binding protein [Streptomyces sp. MST-110588]